RTPPLRNGRPMNCSIVMPSLCEGISFDFTLCAVIASSIIRKLRSAFVNCKAGEPFRIACYPITEPNAPDFSLLCAAFTADRSFQSISRDPSHRLHPDGLRIRIIPSGGCRFDYRPHPD